MGGGGRELIGQQFWFDYARWQFSSMMMSGDSISDQFLVGMHKLLIMGSDHVLKAVMCLYENISW